MPSCCSSGDDTGAWGCSSCTAACAAWLPSHRLRMPHSAHSRTQGLWSSTCKTCDTLEPRHNGGCSAQHGQRRANLALRQEHRDASQPQDSLLYAGGCMQHVGQHCAPRNPCGCLEREPAVVLREPGRAEAASKPAGETCHHISAVAHPGRTLGQRRRRGSNLCMQARSLPP